MCGINGILSFSSNLDLKKCIDGMNTSLNHRGPDDSGCWIDQNRNVALGQTRLSILDLSSSGHQPMVDEQIGNVITYNGEVFNYKSLNKNNLEGNKFKSNTDTETILKLYGKEGVKMLPKLNGMFAFAIWDETKECLILARDRSGKKPLYYSNSNGFFAFASELKALFTLPWISKELDEKVMYDFLTYNTVATPNTMFKGIYKMIPGNYMIIDKNGIKEYESFNDLKFEKLIFDSEKTLEDMIFNKLKESVELRMISDVPVGAFLSGGVDSSAIVALMRENTNNDIKTFTIGFENQPKYNELQFAELISKKYNTNHFIKTITQNDLLDFIPRVVEIYDEPQADTTAIPIYFISQLAKENNIKVVLNGDGPDELFSGYSNYSKFVKNYKYYNLASKAPSFIKKIVYNSVQNFRPDTPISEIFQRLYLGQELYWPGAGGMKESVKRKILSDKLISSIGSHSSHDYIIKIKEDFKKFQNGEEFDYINWLCYSGYKQAVIEKFLYRSDRLGMAHSIESRSPFLDQEMVRLALSIPGKYKIKNGENKYILKKSLERILPNEILYRKKMGFNLPIREWAGDTIGAYVNDNIIQFSKETGWFNPEMVKHQVKLLKDGNSAYTNSIWSLFFIMNWYKKWF